MIGIISDTHSNLDNAQRAVSILAKRGIQTLMHCGDIGDPAIVELFSQFDVWFVAGNADHDFKALARASAKSIGPGHLNMTQRLEQNGKKIVVCHGHTDALSRFIEDGGIDYLFHGHTHHHRDKRKNGVRIINPGALGGLRREGRSFAILDETIDALEFVKLR